MVMFSYIHISYLGLKTPRFCHGMSKVGENPGNILNIECMYIIFEILNNSNVCY